MHKRWRSFPHFSFLPSAGRPLCLQAWRGFHHDSLLTGSYALHLHPLFCCVCNSDPSTNLSWPLNQSWIRSPESTGSPISDLQGQSDLVTNHPNRVSCGKASWPHIPSERTLRCWRSQTRPRSLFAGCSFPGAAPESAGPSASSRTAWASHRHAGNRFSLESSFFEN